MAVYHITLTAGVRCHSLSSQVTPDTIIFIFCEKALLAACCSGWRRTYIRFFCVRRYIHLNMITPLPTTVGLRYCVFGIDYMSLTCISSRRPGGHRRRQKQRYWRCLACFGGECKRWARGWEHRAAWRYRVSGTYVCMRHFVCFAAMYHV